MEKNTYPIKWEYKSHSHQIGDTGDYDGYWEITNGKDSLITKEDYDDIEKDLQAIVDLLNNTYANFTFDRGVEAALEAENKWLKQELEELQGTRKQGPVWVKASERLPGLKKPVRWRLDGKELSPREVWYMVHDTNSGSLINYEWLDESATAAAPLPTFWDVAKAFKWAAEYKSEKGEHLMLADGWCLMSDGGVNEELTPGNVAELYCLQNGFEKESTPAAGREESDAVDHEFIDFIVNERDAISKEMLSDPWWLEIPAAKRVAFENVLIAYDQMVEILKKEK